MVNFIVNTSVIHDDEVLGAEVIITDDAGEVEEVRIVDANEFNDMKTRLDKLSQTGVTTENISYIINDKTDVYSYGVKINGVNVPGSDLALKADLPGGGEYLPKSHEEFRAEENRLGHVFLFNGNVDQWSRTDMVPSCAKVNKDIKQPLQNLQALMEKEKYQVDIVRINESTGVVDGEDNTHLEIGNDYQKVGAKVVNKWTGEPDSNLVGKKVYFSIHGVVYEKIIGANGVTEGVGFHLTNPNDATVVARLKHADSGANKAFDVKLVVNTRS